MELMVFTAEEPNPFGLATFGSRGMCGHLNPADSDDCMDPPGLPLKDAPGRIDGDGGNILDAVRSPGSMAAVVFGCRKGVPGGGGPKL
jgi:N-carbamoyl-L-amino-acid hydrolase